MGLLVTGRLLAGCFAINYTSWLFCNKLGHSVNAILPCMVDTTVGV